MTVSKSQLANGVTVVTETMPHLQSVALGVWVGSGARNETDAEHGVSHMLEHMAFKGTRSRSARGIAEAIEAVGGEVNASTSVDQTTFYARLMKDDIALGLDVLGDILTDSVFDPDELLREQHVILQEIGAALDTPEDMVFDLFQEAAYPDQPMGRNILGTAQSVSRFGPDDIRDFLSVHYRGPNIVVGAAGHLDHDAFVADAEQRFSAFEQDAAPASPKARYAGGELLHEKPLQEVQILLGFEGPNVLSDEVYAGQLVSAILGGGMSSRLFQEVREDRGLCYSIYSFHWAFADTGLFGIHAATSEEDVSALMPIMLDTIAGMQDGVSEKELERAKAQMRATFLMALESPVSRAGQLARQILIYGRTLDLDEIIARIDAVTGDDIAAIAARMVASLPTLAAVGPIAPLPGVDDIANRLGSGQPALATTA
jgi:predicted Zn-dependent peptidase